MEGLVYIFYFYMILIGIYFAIMPIVILFKLKQYFDKINNNVEVLKKHILPNITAPLDETFTSQEADQHLREELFYDVNVDINENKAVAENTIEELTEDNTFSTPHRKKRNYERFIGENIFGKIGIIIFVIGIGLFVKYAIDQNWINETLRTILGFATGVGLLGIAGRLQKKYRTFSSLLAGGAFAVFYSTIAIAFHYYHLFSQTSAFCMLVVTTVLMTVLAILYDRKELAIISLVGGFIAPFIVSSGSGDYLVLFTYISILNLGMLGLSIYKKWPQLPMLSFIFTYLIAYIRIATTTHNSPQDIVNMLLFCTLFYFIFLLPIATMLLAVNRKINNALLSVFVVNNFIYLGIGILLLQRLNLSFVTNGLLSLFLAFVNLALIVKIRKQKETHQLVYYAVLGIILTLISATIPLQLEGNFITLFWASEMLLLLWLYVKSKIRIYEYATIVIMILTGISFLMDLNAPISDTLLSDETIFFNGRFATSLFVGLSSGMFAWMITHYRSQLDLSKFLNHKSWRIRSLIASAAIIYFTCVREFFLHIEGCSSIELASLFSSVYIASICYGFRKRFAMAKYSKTHELMGFVNVALYIIAMLNIYSMPSDHTHLLPWINAIIVFANIADISNRYYKTFGVQTRFTVCLNVILTLLSLTLVRMLCLQLGSSEFSAPFSITLGIIGLIQMVVGLLIHIKCLRIISLTTLGIVLSKLILSDLWSMTPLGKIVVFVLLGAILLTLSFLYQKFKAVLFKDDDNL